MKGTIIELKGQVFGSDCVTPLNNAKVEIWHCNTEEKGISNIEQGISNFEV